MIQDVTNTLSQRYIICFLDTIENLKATTTIIILFTSNNEIKFVLFENSNSGRVSWVPCLLFHELHHQFLRFAMEKTECVSFRLETLSQDITGGCLYGGGGGCPRGGGNWGTLRIPREDWEH